jgi:hypothetical protein
MIFPDIKLKSWLKRYPELEIESGICDNCGKDMPTIKPFIEKGAVGLISADCICKKNKNQSMTVIFTDEEENSYWMDFLG